MELTEQREEIIDIGKIKSKIIIKGGYRTIVINDLEFFQGTAFAKKWKSAAVGIRAKYIQKGIPCLLVEDESYYSFWVGRPYTINNVSISSPTTDRKVRYPKTRSSSVPSFSLKKGMAIGLPLLILLGSFGITTWSSRDECRIALDGSYHATGLSQWVLQNIKNSQSISPENLNSISVAQYGCTIVLRGQVSDLSVQVNAVAVAKSTQVTYQHKSNALTRLWNLDRPKTVRPVSKVINQLTLTQRS